jgi:hypothetical protein
LGDVIELHRHPAKMTAAAMSLTDTTVTLELRTVDVETGFLDESIPGRCLRNKLIRLEGDVTVEVLRILNVTLTPERKATQFGHLTGETRDKYSLSYDRPGDFVEGEDKLSDSSASRPLRVGAFLGLTARTYAQEEDSEHAETQVDSSGTDQEDDAPSESTSEADIHALLEQYGAALAAENS